MWKQSCMGLTYNNFEASACPTKNACLLFIVTHIHAICVNFTNESAFIFGNARNSKSLSLSRYTTDQLHTRNYITYALLCKDHNCGDAMQCNQLWWCNAVQSIVVIQCSASCLGKQCTAPQNYCRIAITIMTLRRLLHNSAATIIISHIGIKCSIFKQTLFNFNKEMHPI